MRGSKRYSVSKQEEMRNRQYSTGSSTTNNNNRNKTTKIGWNHILFICLPLCDVFVLITTLSTCYYHTRKNEQSSLLFPNQLSRDDPARAIYSTGISCSAFISLIVTVLKFKQISSIFNGTVNKTACCFGVLSAASQFVLANVPMTEHLMLINITAVSIYLIFTILYCCLHTYLTRNTPAVSNKWIYITRILLLEFALLAGAVLSAFLVPDLAHWNQAPSNVAQTASWCCLAFLLAYKLTFINDLRQMYFRVDILISSSQAEALFNHGHGEGSTSMESRLLFNEESVSTRPSSRSKMSRSSVRTSAGTMSEVNTVFNYPPTRKSSV